MAQKQVWTQATVDTYMRILRDPKQFTRSHWTATHSAPHMRGAVARAADLIRNDLAPTLCSNCSSSVNWEAIATRLVKAGHFDRVAASFLNNLFSGALRV